MTTTPGSAERDAIGGFWLTALYEEDGHAEAIRIDHADPRIRISAHLLLQLHSEMDFGTYRCAGASCPLGDVLCIEAVNRTVVYRVTGAEHGTWLEGDAVPNCYIAEWPD